MNDLLLFWSNVLLVLLEVIVLVFFASVFFKKNLSRRKFGASVILLAILNITALALLDSHFWSKAFAVIIVDAIWLKIAYDDTIMQSIGIAIGFYSFVSVWDGLVLLAVSFLSKKAFSTYMENPMEYYLICYGVKCLELLLTVIIGLFAKNRFQFKNTTWKDWLRATLFPLTTIFCSVIFFQIYEVESAVGTELLLCEIILLFFDVMAIWILDYMDQQQAALQDNIILKRSIKQEKESMEALVEAYSDQRKKTHDFQNQLAVIYGLAQQESPNGEIIKYVEPLLKKELLPTLITKTGRNVVDILLTQVMYNNRRNNRFNIFIGAIIVSLLVLLTGCTSTKRKIDLTKPVAEDSSNPVTLTVYLTAHYANPDTHCPIHEKLLNYQKENPNITIQFVSPKEGDTAEREAEIHQLNTEILSGKGPDLFIMEGKHRCTRGTNKIK